MDRQTAQAPREEGYLVEFKEFKGGLSVAELAKTLCAFANTDGGAIYLGVTDSGRIAGIKITPQLLDHIQNAAREVCIPQVPIKLSEIRESDKTVLKIEVEKSSHLHSVSSGQTFIRVGTQDKRVMGQELLRLAETKSQTSFEEQVMDIGIEAIDAAALKEYYDARRSVSNAGRPLSDEELLIKMGLAKKENGGLRIKAGAFILFGKEGEQALLQRDYTFVRYDIEGKMYSFREDLSLPATRLLKRLRELIGQFNRFTEGMEGLKRVDKYRYPEDAIREALVNSVAHRDYRIAGLKNECRMYPDRLEIISAGGLPNIITLENMDKRHYSRNPKIMQALLILGLTEELGQGIKLIKNELKANGNPPPDFFVQPDQVKVVFYKQRVPLSEIDIKKIMEDHFSFNRSVTRRQIEAMCGIRSTTAKYLIERLISEGFLVKVGSGPSVRYERPKKGAV